MPCMERSATMPRKRIIEDLVRDEGSVIEGNRHVVYEDHLGYQTIGYGRLLDPSLKGGITEGEARYLLNNDITKCERQLDTTFSYYSSLPEPIQRGLINMCFNLGLPRLKKLRENA